MIELNVVLCVLLAYISFAFLVAGHPPRTMAQLVLQVGLSGCFALFGVAAVIPVSRGVDPAWWSLLLRAALLIVGGWLYNERFGIARHARMLMDWVKSRPSVVASAPAKARSWWTSHR